MSIKKGLKIAIFGAFLTLLGDVVMGANPAADVTFGAPLLDMFADAVHNSDIRMVIGGMLGAIGIPFEGVGYYQVYKMLKPQKGIMPTIYKWASFAYIALAGCGVHLACAVVPMLYKWIAIKDPTLAVEVASKYATYFMMPPMVIFGLTLFVALLYQAIVFAKGKTLYPRHAALFNMAVGALVASILSGIIPNHIIAGGIGTAAISVGSLWMFIMLLVELPDGLKEE